MTGVFFVYRLQKANNEKRVLIEAPRRKFLIRIECFEIRVFNLDSGRSLVMWLIQKSPFLSKPLECS